MKSVFTELILMALAVVCVYRGTNNLNFATLTGALLLLDLKRRPRAERVDTPPPGNSNPVKVGRYTSTTQ